MTPREQVLACLAGERPDRVPMRDAPLGLAIERWEQEGMPKGGFPSCFFKHCIDGTGFDDSLRLPLDVLEDDGKMRLSRDANGVTRQQLIHSSASDHPTDFLIKTRADWETHKGRLAPDIGRIPKATLDWYRDLGAKRKTWACVVVGGPFGHMCELIGMPRTLEVMAEDPDWFQDVAETYVDYHLGMLELVRSQGIKLDGIFVADDITFITGPLFSPAMFRDLIMPGEKQMYDYMHDCGGHVYRHTDGNNWKLIPLLIEAGIDFLDPLEVKAGMDLQELKDAFGRKLVWVGNIDARILYRGDKAHIEEEVRRKFSVFPEGGYVFRTDGPITEEASLESYRWLIECVRKYGEYPP
jgi:uroporphyrinogen decarboxylase